MCDNLWKLLDERDISRYKLSKATGIPQTTIAGWYAGTKPAADKLGIVAEYLGVTVDYLLGNEEKPTDNRELSKDDRILVENIMKLPEDQRRLIAAQIKAWLKD